MVNEIYLLCAKEVMFFQKKRESILCEADFVAFLSFSCSSPEVR
jgi:hypothetical protein